MRLDDGDGFSRFACHRRFPYFLLNTHERSVALQRAGVFVNRDPEASRLSLGRLRALVGEAKSAIFGRLSVYGAVLRNTPSFFRQRRNELKAMIEQLGDPHVFATSSHADTHCPYLHQFIVTGAKLAGTALDPFAPGLQPDVRYKRRAANVVAYPHLVAQYFHQKASALSASLPATLFAAPSRPPSPPRPHP